MAVQDRSSTFRELFWSAAAHSPAESGDPRAVVSHALYCLEAFDKGEVLNPKTRLPLTLMGVLASLGADENLLYASPEQARGEAVEESSLVFTVGVLVFERLTHHHPFSSGNEVGLDILRRGEMGAAVNYFPSVPRELRAVLMKAMAAFPEQRYERVGELTAELNTFARIEEDFEGGAIFEQKTMVGGGIFEQPTAVMMVDEPTDKPASAAERPPRAAFGGEMDIHREVSLDEESREAFEEELDDISSGVEPLMTPVEPDLPRAEFSFNLTPDTDPDARLPGSAAGALSSAEHAALSGGVTAPDNQFAPEQPAQPSVMVAPEVSQRSPVSGGPPPTGPQPPLASAVAAAPPLPSVPAVAAQTAAPPLPHVPHQHAPAPPVEAGYAVGSVPAPTAELPLPGRASPRPLSAILYVLLGAAAATVIYLAITFLGRSDKAADEKKTGHVSAVVDKKKSERASSAAANKKDESSKKSAASKKETHAKTAANVIGSKTAAGRKSSGAKETSGRNGVTETKGDKSARKAAAAKGDKKQKDPPLIAAAKIVARKARACRAPRNAIIRVAVYCKRRGRVVRAFARGIGTRKSQLKCLRRALVGMETHVVRRKAGFIEWRIRLRSEPLIKVLRRR
jgi:hypothetical protein